MAKLKIFFDSNVFISGLLSRKASPFLVLKLADEKKYNLYSGKFILAEIERNLAQKAPQVLPYFWTLWYRLNPQIITVPNSKNIRKYQKIINYLPDQVILAACEQVQIDYLITLDKKHLLKQKVQNKTKVKIIRPEELMKMF